MKTLTQDYASPIGEKVIKPLRDFPGISKWGWFNQIGYKPHPGQEPFHKSMARFKILYAGARFGKSCAAAREVEPLILTPNTNGWIVGPTYELGEKEFRYIYDDLITKLNMPVTECSYNIRQGNFIIRFPWNSFVTVKSAERPQQLLGEELDWVIMAEAAEMREDVWSRYIRMRLHTRSGLAIFATSPKGYGWLWKRAKLGDPPNEKWHTFYGDSRDNPHNLDVVDPDEMSEEDYNEQVRGIPSAKGGRCFSEFHRATHVCPCRSVLHKKGYRYYCCIDFGYTNAFVCLWFAVDRDDNFYFYREYYQKKRLIDEHIRVMKTYKEPIEQRIVDHDAKDRRRMLDRGLDTKKANKDIEAGIRSLKRLLCSASPSTPSGRRITVDPSCVHFIRQLEECPWQETRDSVKEIYIDKDNDALDAARYGVHTLESVGAWGI